eukprot:6822645-Pyramimonas_sp.AAC.1
MYTHAVSFHGGACQRGRSRRQDRGGRGCACVVARPAEGLPRHGRRGPGGVRWCSEAGSAALAALGMGASPGLGARRRC